MRGLGILSLGLGFCLLGACATRRSKLNPDVVQRMNSRYEKSEAAARETPRKGHPPAMLLRIWGDRPAYVRLLRESSNGGRSPRLVSAVAPGYPISAVASGIDAKVTVAIVIDEKGKVEAARILESSDSQFNGPALRAAKLFKFLPASKEDGTPEKHFTYLPFNFSVPDRRPTVKPGA